MDGFSSVAEGEAFETIGIGAGGAKVGILVEGQETVGGNDGAAGEAVFF